MEKDNWKMCRELALHLGFLFGLILLEETSGKTDPLSVKLRNKNGNGTPQYFFLYVELMRNKSSYIL